MRIELKCLILLVAISLLAATGCTPYQVQGGSVGAYAGGLAGALLDHRNPWRGGVIGAALGALAGATISEVSVQGARQAARYDRPVVYRTDNVPGGYGGYIAEPMGRDAYTKCKKVRERIYENERLVSDRIKEVCEGQKYEPGY
jgi:hypothetical protein